MNPKPGHRLRLSPLVTSHHHSRHHHHDPATRLMHACMHAHARAFNLIGARGGAGLRSPAGSWAEALACCGCGDAGVAGRVPVGWCVSRRVLYTASTSRIATVDCREADRKQCQDLLPAAHLQVSTINGLFRHRRRHTHFSKPERRRQKIRHLQKGYFSPSSACFVSIF